MLAHYMWHLGAYATMCRPYAGHTLAHASKTDTSTARWEVRGGPGGLPASTGIVCFEGNEEKWIQEVLSYGGVWHKRGGVLEVKHVFCMYRTCAQQLMDLVMGISFSLLWWMWELLANKMPGSCVYHEGWVVAGYVTVSTVSLAIQLKHNFAFPITATGGA